MSRPKDSSVSVQTLILCYKVHSSVLLLYTMPCRTTTDRRARQENEYASISRSPPVCEKAAGLIQQMRIQWTDVCTRVNYVSRQVAAAHGYQNRIICIPLIKINTYSEKQEKETATAAGRRWMCDLGKDLGDLRINTGCPSGGVTCGTPLSARVPTSHSQCNPVLWLRRPWGFLVQTSHCGRERMKLVTYLLEWSIPPGTSTALWLVGGVRPNPKLIWIIWTLIAAIHHAGCSHVLIDEYLCFCEERKTPHNDAEAQTGKHRWSARQTPNAIATDLGSGRLRHPLLLARDCTPAPVNPG